MKKIYIYYICNFFFLLIKLISWSNSEKLKLSLDLCDGGIGFIAKFFNFSVCFKIFLIKCQLKKKKLGKKKRKTPKHQECNKLHIQERKFTL